ncbi:MAG: DUF2183 domain-containing protein [Planctomycetales bacterium]|nr:DUF2183 domain-containing protein [Planctomycetales bacterium]
MTFSEVLRRRLNRSVATMDGVVDRQVRRWRRRLGFAQRPAIQPYIGYATNTTVHLHGRVLRNPPKRPSVAADRWWHNMKASVRRFASDEVANVHVRAELGHGVALGVSDSEGYFGIELPRLKVGSELQFWSIATLNIVDHPLVSSAESRATCPVMNVDAAARFMLISDVDDTVMHTGATSMTTLVKLTFFANARTRAPLPGIAAWYRAMQQSGSSVDSPRNPIFYVSSSPWNLFDLLYEFLNVNAIPPGPLLLRDLGFDGAHEITAGHEHKLLKIRKLIEQYPNLQVILSGDSGQDDARLYATAAQEYGTKIAAIFIRDIDPTADNKYDTKVAEYVVLSEAAGVPMYVVKDSIEAAEHCAELGLLDPQALDAISKATQRDQDRMSGPLMP